MNDSITFNPIDGKPWMNTGLIHDDECKRADRDKQSDEAYGYTMFDPKSEKCNPDGKSRVPDWAYDHNNLFPHLTEGPHDTCHAPYYNELRLNPSQVTRDRCRQQIFTRLFHNLPTMKIGGDLDTRMRVERSCGPGSQPSGNESLGLCARRMETVDMTEYWRAPLVPGLQEQFNDPDTTVEPWYRGGDSTRRVNRTICSPQQPTAPQRRIR